MILGFSRVWWMTVGLMVLSACAAVGDGRGRAAVGPVATDASGTAMGQVVGILDYVSSDYGGAVRNGRVVSASEYREQLGLVDDATGIAQQSGGAGTSATVRELGDLRGRMQRYDSPEGIAEACRTVRTNLVERYGLTLTPTTLPSLTRARALYQADCALCHGPEGNPQTETEQARALTPHPTDFTSYDRMAAVSPYRAFHGVTYGVRNTGMASFDVLSAEDRWSLAFFVVGLRYEGVGADVARGRRLFERAGRPVIASAARLSQMTESDLTNAIAQAIPDKRDQWNVMAYLRDVAPYEAPAGGPFATARELLARAMDDARTGHREAALRTVIASYLDGIEPHEAALRARDPGLTTRIEDAYVALRGELTHNAPMASIENHAASINALLDAAEGRRGTSRGAAFVGSLVISLREGIEAALLVAALLSSVRRRGHPAQARYVHAGWVLALPAGVVTWRLAGAALSGADREVTEGAVSLLAATVLLMVSHWMLGRRESQRWLKFLERRISDAGSRGARWALAGIAFGAVYREAFEVVLFYRALMIDASGHAAAVGVGALTGVGILAGFVAVVQRVGFRLRPRPFMLASSVVLSVMVLVFAGRGVRSLQEAGVFPLSPVQVPELPWLGIYATREGMVLQGLIVGFLVATAIYSLTGGGRVTRTHTPSVPSPTDQPTPSGTS